MSTQSSGTTALVSLACVLCVEALFGVSGAFAQAIFEKSVVSGVDDAEERLGTKAMDLGSSDLKLIWDGADQLVGIRFTAVQLSSRDFVTRAYVQFTVDENQNADTGTLTIQGQAADNAAAFTTIAGNISSRARTAAAVSWDPPAWTTAGATGVSQRTNNLATVIQEITSRPGWKSGNALVLIISGTSGYKRVAAAYEGGRTVAPKLHVEYRGAYYGHLHNHTGFSDGVGTPEQHYDDARRSGLDFLGIADHDWGLDDTKWGKVKAAAKAKTAEGKFLAFHGFEWTSDRAQIPAGVKPVGHIAVINTSDRTKASASATDTLAELIAWLDGRSSAIAFYNHPGELDEVKPCDFFALKASPRLVGMELWNKTRGFGVYYDNDGCRAGDGKSYFDEALQSGWMMGAAGSRDMHTEFVVSSTSTNYASSSYRLGVWSNSLTTRGFQSALQERRFFSTMDGNLLLWFDIGGAAMGSSVSAGSRTATVYALDATSRGTDTIARVELVRGNRTSAVLTSVQIWLPNKPSFRGTKSITCLSGDYFYVRVTEADGGRAISSPVWVR